MRKAAIAWLLGWMVFGFPWTSFSPNPRVDHVAWNPLGYERPGDRARNVAYYIPFGVMATQIGWPTAATVSLGATLSLITECSQLFSTTRYPSLLDLLLNTVGVIFGIAITNVLRARRHQSGGTLD